MNAIALTIAGLVIFFVGYFVGESGAYGRGYRDASDIYSVPTWTYKNSVTRKKRKKK